MDSAIIGAMAAPGNIYKDDYDDDGLPEVIFATGAPMNGVSIADLDDAHSYLIAYDLDQLPAVKWSKEKGGNWTNMRLLAGNFDGDGKRELWTGISFDGGNGDRMVVLGEEPKPLGKWTCGA